MVSNRLKDFIFKKLYGELSHVEIIHYKTFVWFIDRKDKCWYFRYDKTDGNLLWRYGFFSSFFTLFTMCPTEFVPIISSWVEEVLNHKVTTTKVSGVYKKYMVEEVLNCKVTTTQSIAGNHSVSVEEVLNCKVTTTSLQSFPWIFLVEEVLNHKVTTTTKKTSEYSSLVEEVLKGEDFKPY